MPWGVLTFGLGRLRQAWGRHWLMHGHGLWGAQGRPLSSQPRLPVVAGVIE
jgi:hypothetical protein